MNHDESPWIPMNPESAGGIPFCFVFFFAISADLHRQEQLTKEGYYSVYGKAGARTEMPGCSLCMGNQAGWWTGGSNDLGWWKTGCHWNGRVRGSPMLGNLLYMCICMYIYIYIHTYIYIDMHMYVNVCTYVYIYISTYKQYMSAWVFQLICSRSTNISST